MARMRLSSTISVAGLSIALMACSGSPETEVGADAPDIISLTSVAFENASRIPDEHTCEGADTAPPLRWDGAPAATQSFALIATDYDAPSPSIPLFEIVHWTVANIPADWRALPQGLRKDRLLENGIYQGDKTGGVVGYYGPCPPFGEHTYYYIIYALDTKLALPTEAISKGELLEKMAGHIIAKGTLTGTYSR